MKTLLVYATNSSGTYQAAEIVRERLEAGGHTVTMQHARDTKPADLKKFPAVVLGSCTWERFEGKQHLEGQLQQHMHALAQALHGQKLEKQLFALFALGDRSYTEFGHAAELLEAMVEDAGGKPVIQTMRIDSWFFDQDANRHRIREWADHVAKKFG